MQLGLQGVVPSAAVSSHAQVVLPGSMVHGWRVRNLVLDGLLLRAACNRIMHGSVMVEYGAAGIALPCFGAAGLERSRPVLWSSAWAAMGHALDSHLAFAWCPTRLQERCCCR